jgi:magnesium transporter
MTVATAYDFTNKSLEPVSPGDVRARIAEGKFCWIEIDDLGESARILADLGIGPATIERVEEDQAQGQFQLDRDCIHCVLVETVLGKLELDLKAVHLVIGEGFLVTVSSHPSPLIAQVRATSVDDFHAMAETGGFLLFEIADHLIVGYREILTALTYRVEAIQKDLLGDIGDEILGVVSELTRALLDYRNAVVSARETIHELATRRSAYVSETTQPFLDRQTVSLDRLVGDAATERTVLSETLALYMGIVSHRTNKVVNRLTVVSMLFLPLNFLAAVYGMNFEHMPELGWRHGYLGFWLLIAVLVTVLLIGLRRRRWF